MELTITLHDPARMTVEDRIAEIADILAAGYRRLSLSRKNRKNSLADLDRESAHGNKTESAEEVA